MYSKEKRQDNHTSINVENTSEIFNSESRFFKLLIKQDLKNI